MLTAYIEAAMRRAVCKRLPADDTVFCEIPELPGVWSHTSSQEAARIELREVLEEWILLRLSLPLTIPTLDDIAPPASLA